MDAFHRGIALIGGIVVMILGVTCLEASPDLMLQILPGIYTPMWLVAIAGVISGLLMFFYAIFSR